MTVCMIINIKSLVGIQTRGRQKYTGLWILWRYPIFQPSCLSIGWPFPHLRCAIVHCRRSRVLSSAKAGLAGDSGGSAEPDDLWLDEDEICTVPLILAMPRGPSRLSWSARRHVLNRAVARAVVLLCLWKSIFGVEHGAKGSNREWKIGNDDILVGKSRKSKPAQILFQNISHDLLSHALCRNFPAYFKRLSLFAWCYIAFLRQ